MRLLDKTTRLNARAGEAALALTILLVLGTCLIGYTFALGAQREGAPGAGTSADISGVWVGQLSEKMADGRIGHGSLYLRLRQDGTHISGVAGDTEASASSIENPELNGKQLKLSVGTPRGPQGGVRLKLELEANGDAMEGKGHFFRSTDNHAWDVEIKLARRK